LVYFFFEIGIDILILGKEETLNLIVDIVGGRLLEQFIIDFELLLQELLKAFELLLVNRFEVKADLLLFYYLLPQN
jgi:hypothetical protein